MAAGTSEGAGSSAGDDRGKDSRMMRGAKEEVSGAGRWWIQRYGMGVTI